MPPLTILELVGADFAALGIPALDFDLAFNLIRFAAICHCIKGRRARGTAASDHAARPFATC